VLILIAKTENGLELLFTKRTESVEHHKGQISFPGGASEALDKGPADTALRESFEEIGLDPAGVSLLGTMDDLQTPTGFVVTPVVGYVENLPPLRLNVDEVAQVILIPLERFFDDTLRRSDFRERGGTKVETYFYDVWKEPVWGATAFFVKQLVDLLRCR
jgi:8-oxo-dGTP pyrophosphatase MutT (NUDIX family)